ADWRPTNKGSNSRTNRMLTKAAAYRRLGITQDRLLTVPQITPMLAEIMSGLAERSLPTDPLYYLNASADADARKLILLYYSVPPSARALLPLEAFCLAASIDPNSILDAIVNAVARL